MTLALSSNAKAILLLTAPLISGRTKTSLKLLAPGEYKRLAFHLRKIERTPADLISTDASDTLKQCSSEVDESRLQQLLGRGFQLSQAVEHWQSRAIWVVSRADLQYPRRLKMRLREDAPPIIYGCGDSSILDTGGLAVVGSRNADPSLIEYTKGIGQLTALASRTLVSGGARGIDQAAMQSAWESGGKVCGVLADSLEKKCVNRVYRNLLLNKQLVLVSHCDPSAGFNVGNAMQRNKYVYAMSDAALVVNSDSRGGTWEGAREQLVRFGFAPVHVRSTGKSTDGLDALRKLGALDWPNPQSREDLQILLDTTPPTSMASTQLGLSLDSSDQHLDTDLLSAKGVDDDLTASQNAISEPAPPSLDSSKTEASTSIAEIGETTSAGNPAAKSSASQQTREPSRSPSDVLYRAAADAIKQVLITPKNSEDIAVALDVSRPQASRWLQRLLDEGVVEKKTRPVRYVVK